MLDPRINLGDPPKDLVEEWAQNHCLFVILSGVNTTISQKTVIAMHNLLHNGVLKYHNVQLGNIEVNGKRFAPPPKVRLNEHNIVNFEHGILEMFRQTDTT